MAGEGARLVVVRHGETVWNVGGRLQGHGDSELSADGVAQARALAGGLAGGEYAALYSSDLGRAMATAEIVGRRLGLGVVAETGLREWSLGVLEGLTVAEARRQAPRAYACYGMNDVETVIPGGESRRQACERSVACAEDLARRHPGERIILVTHGGVLHGFFRHAVGLGWSTPRRFSVCNASINTFTVRGRRWRLETWGDVRHLGDMQAMEEG